MKTQVYSNMIKFNEALAELQKEFDLDASNRLPRWYFQDTNGVVYKSACAAHLFEALNSRFGDFIDPRRSMARKRNYVISFLEKGEKVSEVVVEEPVSLVVVEDLITEPLVEATEEGDKPLHDEVDWDWINVLKGTREDKLTLDKYAEDKFGIKLNRGKKIDKMVAEFKEALAAL